MSVMSNISSFTNATGRKNFIDRVPDSTWQLTFKQPLVEFDSVARNLFRVI